MQSFLQYVQEMQSNEHLATLLDKHGGHYGSPDEKVKHLSPTVSLHSNKFGSHRFVKHDGHGNNLAAIQVMSKEKGKGHVANAYTHKDHRRMGHGKELMGHIQKKFKHLTYSDDRSGDGEAFVHGVQR
jgi:ribosomal protein S18 acetylase RimI-like enzyme